jgi:plasmid stabilization system protein ParE
MDLVLLFKADSDIQAGFNRYEEFQTGRGELFLRHVDVAFELILQNPQIGPVYKNLYRRMLVREFPYGIFYQIQPTRIVVVAIIDLRQHLSAIRKILGLQ